MSYKTILWRLGVANAASGLGLKGPVKTIGDIGPWALTTELIGRIPNNAQMTLGYLVMLLSWFLPATFPGAGCIPNMAV